MPKASKTGAFRKAAAADAAISKKKDGKTSGSQGSTLLSSETENKALKEDPQPTVGTEDEKHSSTITQDESEATPLSRGQRKRLAKQKQYQRKQQMIMSSLKLKRAEEQKKRIDGLDAIREALLDAVQDKKSTQSQGNEGSNATTLEDSTEDVVTKPNLLKTTKSQKLLVEKETAQLSLVVQHPAFQADPFATIREHLKNTLAPDVALQKRQEAQRVKEQAQKQQKSKKEKRMASSNSTTFAFKKKRKQHRARPTRSRGSK